MVVAPPGTIVVFVHMCTARGRGGGNFLSRRESFLCFVPLAMSRQT